MCIVCVVLWYSGGQYNQQSAALECLTILDTDEILVGCSIYQLASSRSCLTIMTILWQVCRSIGHPSLTRITRPSGLYVEFSVIWEVVALDWHKVATLQAVCLLQSKVAEHNGGRATRHKINLYNSYTGYVSCSTCALESTMMYAGTWHLQVL